VPPAPSASPPAPLPLAIRDPVSGVEPPPPSDACVTLPSESVEPPLDLPPKKLYLLLRFFLDGTLSVLDVCEHCDVSVPELYAWTQSPDAQMRFEMIRRLAKLRDELIELDTTPQLRQTLFHLAVFSNPEVSTSSRESRRKAAMALLFGPPRVPRSSGAAPAPRSPNPDHPETPPPADHPPSHAPGPDPSASDSRTGRIPSDAQTDADGDAIVPRLPSSPMNAPPPTPEPQRALGAPSPPFSPCTRTPTRPDETPPPPRAPAPHPTPAPPP